MDSALGELLAYATRRLGDSVALQGLTDVQKDVETLISIMRQCVTEGCGADGRAFAVIIGFGLYSDYDKHSTSE